MRTPVVPPASRVELSRRIDRTAIDLQRHHYLRSACERVREDQVVVAHCAGVEVERDGLGACAEELDVAGAGGAVRITVRDRHWGHTQGRVLSFVLAIARLGGASARHVGTAANTDSRKYFKLVYYEPQAI